jgi:hypothetical protein
VPIRNKSIATALVSTLPTTKAIAALAITFVQVTWYAQIVCAVAAPLQIAVAARKSRVQTVFAFVIHRRVRRIKAAPIITKPLFARFWLFRLGNGIKFSSRHSAGNVRKNSVYSFVEI